jgi:ElaB/YqjD/DUF883 family membrane-anchored ribosome-binding protein
VTMQGEGDREIARDVLPDDDVGETIYVSSRVTDADATATPEAPDEIRADIDQTRDEVAGTLDQIGARLDPGHLADQAKEKVRDATIGRVEEAVESAGHTARGIGDMAMETIKRNPIPTAMAGIGLAWLWMSRAQGQPSRRTGWAAPSYDYANRYATYSVGTQGQGGPGITDKAKGIAGGVADTAGSAAENVGRTAGQVAEGAGQMAGEAVARGQQAAEQVGTSFDQLLRSNPLGVAAAAFGAGAAVGLLIPETEPEHRVLGEASDQVGRVVQQGASQALDKVEEAADKAEQKLAEQTAG